MRQPWDVETTDEAVYRVIESVPGGNVTSYGAVAALLGLSTPRRPAAAMRRAPDDVPWWRIIRSDGTLPPGLLGRATAHWVREGTPHTEKGASKAAFWTPNESEWASLKARLDALTPAADVGPSE